MYMFSCSPTFWCSIFCFPGFLKATYMPQQFMMFLFVHLFALGALDHDWTNLHRLIFSSFLLGLCFKSSKMDIWISWLWRLGGKTVKCLVHIFVVCWRIKKVVHTRTFLTLSLKNHQSPKVLTIQFHNVQPPVCIFWMLHRSPSSKSLDPKKWIHSKLKSGDHHQPLKEA